MPPVASAVAIASAASISSGKAHPPFVFFDLPSHRPPSASTACFKLAQSGRWSSRV